jgi:hypothetical protein
VVGETETRLSRWLVGLREYPIIRWSLVKASWWFIVAGVALVAAWVVGEIEFAPAVPLGLSILFLSARSLLGLMRGRSPVESRPLRRGLDPSAYMVCQGQVSAKLL